MSKNSLKLVVVGDGAVGKTCLLITYATKSFPMEYIPTCMDGLSVTILVEGQPMSLQLQDTAAQEGYDRLRPLTYPQTDIFLICYSVVSPPSFDNVTARWLPELKHHSADVPYLIIATKTDLRENSEMLERLAARTPSQKPVTFEEGQRVAKRNGAVGYLECSSLNQVGVEKIFEEAIKVALRPPARRSRWRSRCQVV